jgi:azurin
MSSAGVNKSAVKNKNSSETNDQPVAKVLKPVTINVKVVPNVIQFNKKLLTVKAGQKVTITLENPDVMQHNMVIIKPGTLQKVGAAADALARDPNGAQKQYVPRMPEVLWFIKLLNPDEEGSMQFTAPSQPGDYPFVCTFPGHWRIMNGILRVVK